MREVNEFTISKIYTKYLILKSYMSSRKDVAEENKASTKFIIYNIKKFNIYNII